MGLDRDDEVLLNIACGLDPLTAVVAAPNDERPPQRSSYLTAMLIIGGVLWAIAKF